MPRVRENRRPPVPTQVPRVVRVKDPVRAMTKALTRGDTWALPHLLTRGCRVDMLLDEEEGVTPLMFLVSKETMCVSDLEVMRFLISEGYDLSSLTHSLTYSLTHLLTYSLTHSITQSLNHSVTHSITNHLKLCHCVIP
jgi:hypothetical protein